MTDHNEFQNWRLFFQPKDRLRLTIGDDRSYPTVKPSWAAPLSHPNKFLALLDGNEKEIATIHDPAQLSQDSRGNVLEELRRRYLTATVTAILHAKVEFGATYWTVATTRGERDFVTQSLQENAVWLSENQLLLIDVDGNRFEIPDVRTLDDVSREFLFRIL